MPQVSLLNVPTLEWRYHYYWPTATCSRYGCGRLGYHRAGIKMGKHKVWLYTCDAHKKVPWL